MGKRFEALLNCLSGLARPAVAVHVGCDGADEEVPHNIVRTSFICPTYCPSSRLKTPTLFHCRHPDHEAPRWLAVAARGRRVWHRVQGAAARRAARGRQGECTFPNSNLPGMQDGGGCSSCQQLLGDPVRPTSCDTDTGQCMSCDTPKAPVSRTALPLLLQVLGGSSVPGSKDMSDAEWEHEIAVLRACRHTHVVQFQVGGWVGVGVGVGT